jgi:hypothetical protein
MSYFQNVYNREFVGILAISDRQYSKDYKVGPNVNTPSLMCNWNPGPYNTTSHTQFAITYSMDAGNTYNTVSVTLTSGSAQSAAAVCADLNASSAFASMFTASTTPDISRAYSRSVDPYFVNKYPAMANSGNYVFIQANNNFNTNFWAYIPNIANAGTPSQSAEIVLGFNLKAPVVEMPSYFQRYTIDNGYPQATLHLLTQTAENFVITNAGLSTTPAADYTFLQGTSGYFTFTKNTVDSSSRITASIEYPAGAIAGDLARKTTYSYTSTKTEPDVVAQVPYTLTSGDLITPP